MVEGSLDKKVIKLNLFSGEKKFNRLLTFEEFPDEIKNTYDSVEDVFEALKDKQNMDAKPEKGVVIMNVITVKKNSTVEIPS